MDPVDSFLRDVLGDLAVAEGGHFAGQVLGIEAVDLGSPDLAVAAVLETLVHLCNPNSTSVVALAISNDSVVAVHLCLVVAGSEDHIAGHSCRDRDTVRQHSHLLHIHFHWVAPRVLLCLVAVGLVGHIVDPASRRLLGVHSHKPRLVVHIHLAAVDDLLVCNLAVHNLVENSLGRTARVRNHCPRHCFCSFERAAGSYCIHNRRIHHFAERSGRSLDHKTDHSCHIAVAEDSRHFVFAPGPAGTGRGMLDEELGRSWTGRKPCCQSNGGESGVIAGMLQKCTRRRAAFNGSDGGRTAEKQAARLALLLRQRGRGSCIVAKQHGFISSFPGFGYGLRGGRGVSVVVSSANWPGRDVGVVVVS